MLSTLVLFAALAQSAPAPSLRPPAVEAPEIVEVATGAQKILGFQDIRHVLVGNELAIDVKRLAANQVLVVGIAEGNSSLVLVDGAGKREELLIKVRTPEWANHVVRRQLEPLFDTSPRFKVRQSGDRYYLDGLIATVEDYDLVRTVLTTYPTLVFRAQLDAGALEAKAGQINEEFARAGLPGVKATVNGQDLVLEGQVGDEAERKRAAAIADMLFRPLKVLPFTAPRR